MTTTEITAACRGTRSSPRRIVLRRLGRHHGTVRRLPRRSPRLLPGPRRQGGHLDRAGARTATNERYTREWLEQQATAGDPRRGGHRRSAHPPLQPPGRSRRGPDRPRQPLLHDPAAAPHGGHHLPLQALLDAYRNGGGVPYPGLWRRYPRRDRRHESRDVHQPARQRVDSGPAGRRARLQGRPDARPVADIGCGTGWSSIAIAQGFPPSESMDSTWMSLDREARANAAALGLRGPRHLPGARRGRSQPGRIVRLRLRLRMHPRHGEPGGALSRDAQASSARRDRPDRRRARRRHGSGDRRRDRAPDVRLQRAPLPAGRDGRTTSVGTGTVMRADTSAPTPRRRGSSRRSPAIENYLLAVLSPHRLIPEPRRLRIRHATSARNRTTLY